ncbi:hypothetical protein ACIHEI_14260 [Kitasatospora sp. NPDC051984]|uniref:hypothetical protein n=1 Tax=Kitasatospora sp. NPDC051984 TaxID=3364059 RepID=UPI0037C744D2
MYDDYDDTYCDECADYGCPGHVACASCDDDICDECSGCSCEDSYCDGLHRD